MEIITEQDMEMLIDAARDINPGAVDTLLVIESMSQADLVFALREICEE